MITAVLVLVTLDVYAQVGHHQFLNFDDNVCVTENPHVVGGLSRSDISWAFTSFDYIYWQPVTWLSHMAVVQIYGMDPGAHHVTNVLIHTIASCLLLLLLYRTTDAVWQSAFVAFCFALHPLHVESVAWLAERRDTLGALFWFLTLLMYREFMVKRTALLYLLTLAAFLFGIMSKPMLVTLPITMLLMDYWPLNLRDGATNCLPRRVLEKAPFFAGSLVLAGLAVYGQKQAEAVRSLDEMPCALRFGNALVSYVKYIGMHLWPKDLAVLYPHPSSVPLWQVIGSAFVLLLLSALAWRARERHPYCITGWLWFLLTLVPVIGLLQVGCQSMADRYVYIPGIGLFIIAAWGGAALAERLQLRKRSIALAASAVVLAFAVLSWHQLGYWRDNITLYRHALDVTSDNFIINNNLGLALAAGGDVNAAILAYRESIRINPNEPLSRNNLCLALTQNGDLDAAILECREAVWRKPDYADALNNLGIALFQKGEVDNAINEYRHALVVYPDYADAHYNLARALARKGDLDGAIRHFNDALRLTPRDSDAHLNLGVALARKGALDEAIWQFREVLRTKPSRFDAQRNLNVALTQKALQR